MPELAPAGPRSAGSARVAGWLRRPGWVLAVTVPLLVLVVVDLAASVRGHQLDLEVYRLGIQTWLDGGDMYGPLPATLSGRELPFIYPPFAAMVLLPLVVTPWNAAWIALFAVSLGSLAVTLYVVARRAWPAGGRAGALSVASAALPVALALEPVRETFDFGQINLVLMALVALDCLAVRTRWPRGLLVGLAAAIKLAPAAFVLYFLLRRDTRAATVAVLTAVAATGLGFVVDAAASGRYWFGGPASQVSGSVFFSNQTIQAVLARLGTGETVLAAVWAASTVALLLLITPIVRRAAGPLALSALAAFALLVSPTSWSHHWVWVAPALLVIVMVAVRARSVGWALTAVLLGTAFVAAPFHYLPRDGFEMTWSGPQQLVGATYVIIAVALLVLARLRLDRLRVDTFGPG